MFVFNLDINYVPWLFYNVFFVCYILYNISRSHQSFRVSIWYFKSWNNYKKKYLKTKSVDIIQ